MFSEIDSGIEELQKAKRNLELYKESVLNSAIQGKLVPQNQKDESAAILLEKISAERKKLIGEKKLKKEKPLTPISPIEFPFDLPKGWAWARLGELLTAKLCNGISVKGSDSPPGIRALKLSAMSSSGFDYGDIRYLPLKEKNVADIFIQSGDFFISRGNGSLHLVCRGTVAQSPPEPTIFPDTMIRIRFSDVLKETRWVSTIWESRFIRSQIESRVKTTAGIYKIAQPQVESILLPMPPPAEQLRIAKMLNILLVSVQKQSEECERQLLEANVLKQSILKSAFEGKLI